MLKASLSLACPFNRKPSHKALWRRYVSVFYDHGLQQGLQPRRAACVGGLHAILLVQEGREQALILTPFNRHAEPEQVEQ